MLLNLPKAPEKSRPYPAFRGILLRFPVYPALSAFLGIFQLFLPKDLPRFPGNFVPDPSFFIPKKLIPRILGNNLPRKIHGSPRKYQVFWYRCTGNFLNNESRIKQDPQIEVMYIILTRTSVSAFGTRPLSSSFKDFTHSQSKSIIFSTKKTSPFWKLEKKSNWKKNLED